MGRFRWADRLAWLAALLAAIVSAAGLFVSDLYRDNDAMIAQARGTDLATLCGAVPALVVGLWFAHGGSLRGRLVAMGALGYLVYVYAIYAFQVVVGPATPLHIAILGLASWSLILNGIGLVDLDLGTVGERLPRRTAAGFLLAIAVMFGALWLGQIAGAISDGVLPVAVSDLDVRTSAVYALDLAFALPLLAFSAGLLLRREDHGAGVAVAAFTFVALMALSILGLFVVQESEGLAVDASAAVGFTVVGAIAATLACMGVLPATSKLAEPRDIAVATR